MASSTPSFDHIVVVVEENHSLTGIIGNSQAPYINLLANDGASLTNYHAVTHPSEPNYFALYAGSTFGITSDCTTCFVSAPNIAADRVEPSGRTWKGYMESMPSPCFAGDSYPYSTTPSSTSTTSGPTPRNATRWSRTPPWPPT